MKNKKLLGGLSAVGVAGVIGAGLYLAGPALAGAPSPSASPSENARHDRWPGRHGRFDGRHDGHHMRGRHGGFGVHGQATVRRGNGFVQLDWQRGQVTAVGAGALTVRSADGATWQWRTDQKTRVRRDGRRTSVGRLAKNDFVVVFGPNVKGVRTAERMIAPKHVPPHPPGAPGRSPSPSPS